MTCKEELKSIIQTNWSIGDLFTLNEIYQFEEHFSKLYENKDIKAKLRQTLQYLRDDEILEFIDFNGTYKRIN